MTTTVGPGFMIAQAQVNDDEDNVLQIHEKMQQNLTESTISYGDGRNKTCRENCLLDHDRHVIDGIECNAMMHS